jgi:hypothetical protein
MKYSGSFYHDLEFGEEAEDWVKNLFDNKLKVEVKSDRLAHITGRIYIEVYSRNKPSGISTTEADYWIYRIEARGTAIIIPVKRLRELVKLTFVLTNKLTKGGDNNTSKGVLLKLTELL